MAPGDGLSMSSGRKFKIRSPSLQSKGGLGGEVTPADATIASRAGGRLDFWRGASRAARLEPAQTLFGVKPNLRCGPRSLHERSPGP